MYRKQISSKRPGGGKCLRTFLAGSLLAFSLTACGSEEGETEEPVSAMEETEETEEGAETGTTDDGGEASGAGEVADAKSLAALMQKTMEMDGDINAVRVEGDTDVTATITTDIGSDLLTVNIRPSTCNLESGEVRHNISYRGNLGDGYESWSEYYCVLSEDGRQVSYVGDGGSAWQKYEGDCGQSIRYTSDIFERIADGSVETAEYTKTEEEEWASSYSLVLEVSGEALCDMMKQYAFWITDDFSAIDWDNISADVNMEIRVSEYSEPSCSMQIVSADLAEALLLRDSNIKSVENAEFQMELDLQFYEDYEISSEDFSGAIAVDGEIPEMGALTKFWGKMLGPAAEEFYEENFEAITTTDPVTLFVNGAEVTISLPQDPVHFDAFEQRHIYSVKMEGVSQEEQAVTEVTFENEKYPAQFFGSEIENYTSRIEPATDTQNCEINDIYVLDTQIGQMYVLRYSYEAELYGQVFRDTKYYGLLELGTWQYMAFEFEDIRPAQNADGIDYDEMVVTLLNHCSVDGANT